MSHYGIIRTKNRLRGDAILKKKDTYYELRNKMVVKANDLIQKSRFDMSLQQQKIVLFLISQITPNDKEFKEYEFSVQEFCRVCGISGVSGKNYQDLRRCIKELADKSVWVKLNNGEETLLRWVEKPYINQANGQIRIRMDEDMKPYLLQLKDSFTQYELIYTLYFKSKYTIRLYELIKSIHFHELEEYHRTFSLDELRVTLGGENYTEYRDFKRRVLDIAVNEINAYSDKQVSYTPIKKGRTVESIEFTINTKSILERLEIRSNIEKDMGTDQLSLFEQLTQPEEQYEQATPAE